MGKIIKEIESGLKVQSVPQTEDFKSHYNYKHALEMMESEDYYEAYRYFMKELEEYPGNGYAYYQIGKLRFGTNNLELALNAFTEAITLLSPGQDFLWESYTLRAQVNNAMGKEQEMLSDLKAAISLKPEEEELVWYYITKEDFVMSDADFRKYTELAPGNPYPVAGLGQNLFKQGRIDEARKMFEYCIQLNPNYGSAYAFLGQCKFKQDDWSGGIDDCLVCLSLEPENSIAQATLLNDAVSKEFKLLEAKLMTCIQQEPNNVTWMELLGSGYSDNKEWYKAIKMWDIAHNINHDPKYLNYMADEYSWLGDFVRAEGCLRRALESGGDDYDMRVSLSDMLRNQARFEEALRELEICRQQRLDDSRVLTKMADLYRMLDRDEESLEYAQMGVRVGTNDWNISYSWLSLAMIYDKMGIVDKRDETLEQILSRESFDYPRIFSWAILGRYNEALEFMQTSWESSKNSYQQLVEATILAMSNRIDDAAVVLQKSFQYGNHYFDLILHDDTFQYLHKIPDLEEQVAFWRAKANQEFEEKNREIFGA